MSKIFLKIYLKFDLKCFHSIVYRVLLLCCHRTNDSNKHYITSFCIPYNIYSYSYVITATIYQTCP